MHDLKFEFSAELWLYSTEKASWHFVTLPLDAAEEIKFFHGGSKRKGWGSVPVRVTIGDSTWKTSIFPDSKSGSYFLPIKADIRKKEKIGKGDSVTIGISIT